MKHEKPQHLQVVRNEPKSKTVSDLNIPEVSLERFEKTLEDLSAPPVAIRGRVKEITGLLIRAKLPNAHIGELCTIEPPGRKPVQAQVVGFDDEDVFLSPFDTLEQVGPKTPVTLTGETLAVKVGDKLLGRVINSLGQAIDELGELKLETSYPVKHSAPRPLERRRISKMLPLGVRVIDALLPVGEGQRLGVFSTAGVGKSSLLGMIARNNTADVNVVALIGERGREVRDFLEDTLGPEGRKKTVVVVSTSDDSPMRRILAAYTATAIAEYFRDQGKRVMLLMDSVTRFARALREIALSVGESPARQGYPPSVFAALPELFERAGNSDRGSITAFYTVLLATEQMEDALGEEIRALLDGHLYLSSRLSQLQQYPAVDVLQSNSRVISMIAAAEHVDVAEKIRKLIAIYEEHRDLISIGAYKFGSDPAIDESIKKRETIIKFLSQRREERSELIETLASARALVSI
ncbi:FliI/YscN family ATPase [bacterium]|nr:FliI/YscN family ATPase [bacterium]